MTLDIEGWESSLRIGQGGEAHWREVEKDSRRQYGSANWRMLKLPTFGTFYHAADML